MLAWITLIVSEKNKAYIPNRFKLINSIQNRKTINIKGTDKLSNFHIFIYKKKM